MAGLHHWLNGHESEWTLGVGDGQGGLAYCDSWGRKELDTTERLNWTENILTHEIIFYILNNIKTKSPTNLKSKTFKRNSCASAKNSWWCFFHLWINEIGGTVSRMHSKTKLDYRNREKKNPQSMRMSLVFWFCINL